MRREPRAGRVGRGTIHDRRLAGSRGLWIGCLSVLLFGFPSSVAYAYVTIHDYSNFTPDENSDGLGFHDSRFNVRITCGDTDLQDLFGNPRSVADREVNNNNTALYIHKRPNCPNPSEGEQIDNSVWDYRGAHDASPGQTWLASAWVKTTPNIASGGTLKGDCETQGGPQYGYFRARLTIHGNDGQDGHKWETNAYRCGGDDSFKRLEKKVTLEGGNKGETRRIRVVLRAHSRPVADGAPEDSATGKVVVERFRLVRCGGTECADVP